MDNPATLRELPFDDSQLLKEAVCDAVLERTRRTVSGEAQYGREIVGDKPSRVLSSGFILPRIGEDGDDVASDINIASHGLDLSLFGNDGVMQVAVSLSVYVRALPSAVELFGRNGRLIPRADFNDETKKSVRQRLKETAAQEIPKGTPPLERAEKRIEITRRVYSDLGVEIPTVAKLIVADDEASQEAEDAQERVSARERLKIPNSISRSYEIPQKWIRLTVEMPELELAFPCEPKQWEDAAATYNVHLISAIRNTYTKWLETEEGRANAWRKVRPPSEAFWEPARWEKFLEEVRKIEPHLEDLIPKFEVQVLVQSLPDALDPGHFSVRVALENLREGDASLECGLFCVSLTTSVPSANLRPLRLERVKRSYHLSGFMTMPAIGVNGGVIDLGHLNQKRRLRTTWMPRYVLPRLIATNLAEVKTSFSELKKSEDISHLRNLPEAMKRWLKAVEGETSLAAPGEEGSAEDEIIQRARFSDDLHAWKKEIGRISKGVELLIRSRDIWLIESAASGAAPFLAWQMLNEAFADANPPNKDSPNPGWRLFQLAFMLAHIPTLASRIPEFVDSFDAGFDEDAASLLYMSTGGGKTEAFFGTIVLGLFLDRLRGKRRGLTAMMHYPLRLLTVQQAQQLARLLARVEIVRRKRKLSGAPFEIGFWVGGSNTPNSTEKRPGELIDTLKCIPIWSDRRAQNEEAILASKLGIDREYKAANVSWNKLPTCPFCRSEIGTGLRIYPEQHNRLGITCLNVACEWNRLHDTPFSAPLPFLLTDSDIYRRTPSILLGTIDKLALLGQSTSTIDKIAGMFGLAHYVENGNGRPISMATEEAAPAGSIKVAPAFNDGVEEFFDPFPSLIIQDEMHLLEESLGTFGGIFETGLLSWLGMLARLLGARVCRVPGAPDRPRLPHIIGATATAADAAKHTRALYQKNVIQFPHPGPKLYQGFYTRLAQFSEGGIAAERTQSTAYPVEAEQQAPWARIYASLMTNGRLHTVTTLSVLAAHAATITRWERDLRSTPERQQRAAAEIEHHQSDTPYAKLRASAVRGAAEGGKFRLLIELVDLHRIALTYVTNKKGGDQILSALEGEVKEVHSAMGTEYELQRYDTELISGGIDIGGIQSVIKKAEQPFQPFQDDLEQVLRGIVATSAISHGVDVETFNAMAFAGMPSDIAEYIQASSRVGRTHVGFSLLIPTPQTRRDRFVVEVHESFHRLLERMIAPPAVERWADKAIGRTIPSLVQMWLAGVQHQDRFVGAADDRKAGVHLPSTVEQLERALRDPSALQNCIAFVQGAIGTRAAIGGPNNPEYYGDLIRAYVVKIRDAAASRDFTGPLRDFWPNGYAGLHRPMTSLRDVDAPGKIVASSRSIQNQILTWDDVSDAMAVLRNRGSARGRQSSGSELDWEG